MATEKFKILVRIRKSFVVRFGIYSPVQNVILNDHYF